MAEYARIELKCPKISTFVATFLSIEGNLPGSEEYEKNQAFRRLII